MRKLLGFLLLNLVLLQLSAASVVSLDMKSLALGNVGMSNSTSELSFYHNPASLVFRKGTASFAIGGSFIDTIDPEAFNQKLPNPVLADPQMIQNLRFIGKNVALSISIKSKLNLVKYGTDSSFAIYDSINATDLQLTVAYGYSNLAFGLSINGGNGTIRDSITIHDNNTIIDYLLQTLFERYQGIFGSEYVSFTLGVLGRVGNFSIGLTLDETTRIGDGNSISPSIGAMLTTLGFGINYTSPKYYPKTAELVFIVPSISLEIHNAFLSSVAGTEYEVNLPAKLIREKIGAIRKSELCLGAELIFQLSSRFSVSFLTGFRSGPLNSDFYQSAQHSIGAEITSEKIRVEFCVLVPFSTYRGESRDVTICMGLDFSF